MKAVTFNWEIAVGAEDMMVDDAHDPPPGGAANGGRDEGDDGVGDGDEEEGDGEAKLAPEAQIIVTG